MQHAKIESQLTELLDGTGFRLLGWFSMFDGPADSDGQPAVLIGNQGPDMWPAFQASEFAGDDSPNPLDRWTRSIMDPIAGSLNAQALFPFRGEPNLQKHWPFQQWARAATGLRQSPMGLLIDPEFGLWHAFRAVLVFEGFSGFQGEFSSLYPCESCEEKPCLSSCPVDAIGHSRFDVENCRAHINSSSGHQCVQTGCIARNACPVGRKHAYCSEQQAFHMGAYR